jgi:hypothetical protein
MTTHLRHLRSTRDLDDYEILATRTISAAIPKGSDKEYRRYIWGAMVTYAFGNSSIDYVLRRYNHNWEIFNKSFEASKQGIAPLRVVVEAIEEVVGLLEAIDPGASKGRICAKAALCRLEASFSASYDLIRKEYIFETNAVIRIILEQLAWIAAVHQASDEEVYSIQPTKCIAALARKFPGTGNLYGELSAWAHIDPTFSSEYLRFHDEGHGAIRRSETNSLEAGRHLFSLASVFIELVQAVFSPVSPDHARDLLARVSRAEDEYKIKIANAE